MFWVWIALIVFLVWLAYLVGSEVGFVQGRDFALSICKPKEQALYDEWEERQESEE